jgi:ABC-type branched-subunit amino acid transport system substrate-binding protein
MEKKPSRPLKLFYYHYVQEDYKPSCELYRQLKPLSPNLIEIHEIIPGDIIENVVKEHIESAHLVLILISASFLSSRYYIDTAVEYAIKRHNQNEVRLFPILLRPTNLKDTPFEGMVMLPENNQAVLGRNPRRDEVFADIARRIHEVILNEGQSLLDKQVAVPSGPVTQDLEKTEPLEEKLPPQSDTSSLEDSGTDGSVPTSPGGDISLPIPTDVLLAGNSQTTQISTDSSSSNGNSPVESPTETQSNIPFIRNDIKKKWSIKGTKTWVIFICAVLLGIIFFSILFFVFVRFFPPQSSLKLCAGITNLQGCGSGLGVSTIVIHGKEYTLGLNGDFQQQFDPTNSDEKQIEDLILSQNNEAEKGQHFTIILATLLSKSTSDQYTGLEELRGAFLAQQAYNKNHTIKMRLLVANLGVRAVADVSVPRVARQIALYAANAPQNDHFLGVTGFPFSLTLKYGLPILQQNHIPVLGSSPSDNQFSQSPGFHRIESSNSQQVKYLLIFIQSVLHSQHILILSDSSDNFSTDLSNNLITNLNNSSNGVQISYYIGGNIGSLNRALGSIVKINPDLLIFTGFPADLNTLKTTMIQRGLHIPRILGSQTLYELGAYTQPKPGLPSNYANLIFSSFAFPDDNTLSGQAFQQAYALAFNGSGRFPGVYGKGRAGSQAALSYDAILAFQHAVDKLSGNGTIPSMAEVSSTLNTLSFFTGATGNIGFLAGSSDPDPATRPLYILCTNHNAQTQLLVKYNPDSVQKVDLSLCD